MSVFIGRPTPIQSASIAWLKSDLQTLLFVPDLSRYASAVINSMFGLIKNRVIVGACY